MRKQLGSWVVLLALVFGWTSYAQGQACTEELRALQELRQQVRAEIIADHTKAALALLAKAKLETPLGYDFEDNLACQKWAIEVAYFHRASCSFERAREKLASIHTEDALAIDRLRTARQQLANSASLRFSCQEKRDLYLVCQPVSDNLPDAWCVASVEHTERLEFPRAAWCKLVDDRGVELSTVGEGYEPTCREDVRAEKRAQKRRQWSETRAGVATAGTGIAIMAVAAIPISYVPEGFAKMLRRFGALDKHSGGRLHHNSSFARKRVLPLIGVTALSVSSLSSRFWWAGILAAGSGITGDVLLAQSWRHGDTVRRNVGIAAACVGAAGGLVLNLETLGYSDTGSRFAYMPTLSVGVADAELGLAGRF